MSHLAHGADPVLSGDQRRAFEEARAPWKRVPASLANSEGILLGREFHYQMARPGDRPLRRPCPLPGGGLAAGPGDPGARCAGRSGCRLRTGTWKACGPARIATIPVGYGRRPDPLVQQTGAAAWIGERRAPVAGRISMDLATLDVTGIPGVRPGTPATLLGGPATLQDLARASGTIPYEILVSLGRGRFTRRYLPPVEACGRSPGEPALHEADQLPARRSGGRPRGLLQGSGEGAGPPEEQPVEALDLAALLLGHAGPPAAPPG